MRALWLLQNKTVDCEALAHELDRMNHYARVDFIRGIPPSKHALLYEAVSHYKTLVPHDLVPENHPVYTPVEHTGMNNLFGVRHLGFAKVMYLDDQRRVCGRNVQALAWLTGDGYFTVEPSKEAPGYELDISYLKLPTSVPNGWPKPQSNARGFSYVVYRDMVDKLRAVSKHVTIGRAWKHGRALPHYFVLTRHDAALEVVWDVPSATPVTSAPKYARVAS